MIKIKNLPINKKRMKIYNKFIRFLVFIFTKPIYSANMIYPVKKFT
jgi:hypothetical protein